MADLRFGPAERLRTEGAPIGLAPQRRAPQTPAMIRRGGSQKPDRLLATVMFTDIVGSTELARELGDRGWKNLLERHNAVVRRELKRFGGRELDTAGDGFFVMFERPAQAIDCAWAVIEALKPHSIRIRAAVHMGEVEVIGRKIGGIAVHAASRVLSLAQPGQIYVTGIVHDVVAGSEILFSDAGTHELRGVSGEWRIFAVQATSTDRALPITAPPEPVAAGRDWTRILVAVAVVAALAVGATTLAFAALSRPAPVVPRPNSVVRIDPASAAFVALAEIADPTDVAVADGAVWVLSAGGRTLNRIDGATGRSVAVGLPGVPTGLAVGNGAVWITTGFGAASGDPGVRRVGIESQRVEQSIALGDGVDGIAVGEGAVWVTNRLDNSLTRIDLTTQVVGEPAVVGNQPTAVLVGEGSVWVANSIDRTVWRIDPQTLARTAEITVADIPYDLELGFGRLWVTSEQGSSVTLIDVTTNGIQQTLELDGPARGVAAGPDDVWVAIGSGAVVRIDPEDPSAFQRIEVGGAPHDVGADANGTWVSVRE